MSEIKVLEAETRDVLGTGASRALRKNGKVPATLYGNGKKPLSILVAEKDITKLYRKHGFTSTVLQIEIGGKKHKVLPKCVDLNPITDIVRHVDFVYLDTKSQKVSVPIVFEGRDRAIGLKRGGFLNIIFRKIELLCSPDKIPQEIVIDISGMSIGSSIKASKLKLPDGTQLFKKGDFVIASMTGRGGKSTDDGQEEAKSAS